MAAVIKSADLISYSNEIIEQLRTLLYETSEDEFLKLQLKSAVKHDNQIRIMLKTIRLKELFFEKAGDMFQIHLYSNLYSKTVWANFKFISMDRVTLADSMLSWSKDVIHHSLTNCAKNNKKSTKINM